MRGIRFVMVAVLASCSAPALAGVARENVTVLTAATIRTMDPARPVAGAMAFDDLGEILAVGESSPLRPAMTSRVRAASADVALIGPA